MRSRGRGSEERVRGRKDVIGWEEGWVERENDR